MLKELDLVCCGELESVTVAVKVNVPTAVGVPEITPVELFSVSPAGSAPEVTLHAQGVAPPAAIRLVL
jgi:hypothetical protein